MYQACQPLGVGSPNKGNLVGKAHTTSYIIKSFVEFERPSGYFLARLIRYVNANSTLSFRKTTLHTTLVLIPLHTQSLGSHKLLRRLQLAFEGAFGMEHAGGCGVWTKPPHHEGHAISSCPEMCQCSGFEEGLVAEEQVIQWAEDEEGPAPTRHGEQGFGDVCGPVACVPRVRWE